MLPAKKAPQRSFPLTQAEMTDRTLELTQLNPVEVSAFMRKAIDKLTEKLSATKKTYASFEGAITDEREDPDHAIQVKAATELLALGMDTMGLKKRPSGSDAAPKPEITIDLSGWHVTAPLKPSEDSAP